jgi:hypothetical protein
MIDQKFVDVVVPLVRKRFADMGWTAPAVPVIVGIEGMTGDTNMGYTAFHQRCDICGIFDRVPEKVVVRPAGHADIGAKYALLKGYDFAAGCSEEVRAAAVVTHELIHTTLPWTMTDAILNNGHSDQFLERAVKAGLVNDTAAFPGPDFKRWYDDVVVPGLNNGE